jgi:hypothetical protein
LVEKWQERGNQNQNQNPNVKNISTKLREETPKIAIVTHRGGNIGMDVINIAKPPKQWVKKETTPVPNFDPQEDKEAYKQARK